SYVAAPDVVAAVLTAVDCGPDASFTAFNVATGDYITVREIVALALDVLGLDAGAIKIEYGTTDRGWKGDVPVVRLSTERIRSIGWAPSMGSLDALRASLIAMLEDARKGLLA
ncbi:MAG: NAD-dependent epimerase/dehydratase family protein, partial [Solirubrobacteraceae bacterium]